MNKKLLLVVVLLLLCIPYILYKRKAQGVTPRLVSVWENDYASLVIDEFSNFRGHWVNSNDSIVSYLHSSDSTDAHKKLIIRSLGKYCKVYENSENILILRGETLIPDKAGYKDWYYLFGDDNRVVTLLNVNHDKVLEADSKYRKMHKKIHAQNQQ